MMRSFALRVYTLRTKKALDFYRERIHPRHLNSFPQPGLRLTASGPPWRMFGRDIRNFDVSGIVAVEETILIRLPLT